MSGWESVKRLGRRWVISIPLFAVLGLVLGSLIATPLIPRPKVATITISGVIMDQVYTNNILDMLQDARDDKSIKAVVLRINSPGGFVVTTEQIYLDVLRLRQQKPVVASIGTIAASGGYYIAVAANFIYALPTSQVGSIGAFSSLPHPEELDENIITSGPFKATGSSKRKSVAELEMVRQEFTSVVISQRGDRLRLSEEELSRAEVYLGAEGLRDGLIDDIGTSTDAIAKAARLAGIRNYDVVELPISESSPEFFGASDLASLKAQTNTIPIYYYLYFESE